MFLKCRATQAEYFDSPGRPAAEIAEFYATLARVNRFFRFAEPFQNLIPKRLGQDQSRSLRILDLGAGDGALGNLLQDWAARRGWNWSFANLDISLTGLRLSRSGGIVGSVVALPFVNGSFDVVIASQMTHHLVSDEEILRHLREAWRVASRAVFLADLNRGPVLYGLLWVLFHLKSYPAHFRADAMLSVRRGFRVPEMAEYARRAGMAGARVRVRYCTRVILEAMKPS